MNSHLGKQPLLTRAAGLRQAGPNMGFTIRHSALWVIEAHVVRDLAGRLTATQETQLRSQLAAQRESVERSDIDRNIELDVEFHMMLSEFTGNQELHRILLQLYDKTVRAVIQVAQKNHQRLPQNVAEHERIAEPVFAGDGEEAAARLRTISSMDETFWCRVDGSDDSVLFRFVRWS
jgi:DNA-binding FadR family transcriptional regulator